MLRLSFPVLRGLVWLTCLLTLLLNVAVLAEISGQAAPSLLVEHTGGQAVDHVAFWAAGRMANEGAAAAAYDPAALAAMQSAGLGFEFLGEMPWFYPPPTQIAAQPFALLDPFWSLFMWNVVGLGLFLAVIWRIYPDPLALVAAGSAGPVFSVLFNGQIGLYIAAIAGLCLLAMIKAGRGLAENRRAGVWLALLVLKPHTVFALPLAFAAVGMWRILGWACLAGAVICAATIAFQGVQGWAAFFGSLTGTADYFMTGEIASVFWTKYPNIYGVARANDIPFLPAAILQGAASLAALGLAVGALRSPASPPAVAAILIYACVVSSPRIFVYDLPLLMVGAAFQARAAVSGGFRWWEIVVLACAYVLVELGFQSLPHAAALAGPMLLIAAYGRYVYSAKALGKA